MGISSPLPLVGTAGNILTSDGLNWSSKALLAVGIGQTWQNVLGSRAAGVTYTNTTGKPIVVCVCSPISASFGAWNVTQIAVDGFVVSRGQYYGAAGFGGGFVNALVPNGSSYVITASIGVSYWSELR